MSLHGIPEVSRMLDPVLKHGFMNATVPTGEHSENNFLFYLHL